MVISGVQSSAPRREAAGCNKKVGFPPAHGALSARRSLPSFASSSSSTTTTTTNDDNANNY